MRGKSLMVAAGLCGAVGVALACGPYFPLEALDDRAGMLEILPVNGFAYDVAQLKPRPIGKPAPAWLTTAEFEAKTPQAAQLKAMRAAPTAEAALAVGAGLPPAIRDYTAGAVAFRAGALDQARGYFEKVAQHADAASRNAWAAYMIGRLEAKELSAKADVARCDVGAVARRFQQVRQMVAAGTSDPLGLALASLGAEAKLHLDLVQQQIVCPNQSAADQLENAVALYAEQAAGRDEGGAESLRMVAAWLIADDALLRMAVSRPLAQKLLVLYALHQTAKRVMESDSSLIWLEEPKPAQVVRLIDAILALAPSAVANADQLAALSYQQGHFDRAERLMPLARGPLADWLRAKLALRRGDVAAAGAAYAEASRGFVAAGDRYAPEMAAFLFAERGVLAISRSEYAQALRQMLNAAPTFWTDAAYIAERILTVKELRAFVDAEVPAPPGNAMVKREYHTEMVPAARLRYLLARRLAREGDWAGALSYMPPVVRYGWRDIEIDARGMLATYAAARRDAAAAWSDLGAARALFAAARTARVNGMEILGYELEPDAHIYAGGFDYQVAEARLVPAALLSKDEADRAVAHTPPDKRRFTYRYHAADLARQAAEKLPPRSQAYAAVLCHATRWMLSTSQYEPKARHEAEAFYELYLKKGAYVSWGDKFGQECPEPDFDAASYWPLRQAWGRLKRLL